MRTAMILLSFLVVGLVIGWLICFLAPLVRPEYTAQTLIRVLPGTEKGSVIALIKNNSTLELLLDRDKIQQTEWFQGLGKIKDKRLKAAIANLNRRSCARAIPNSDFIRISMTCGNKNDAATITNEIASQFVSSQGGTRRKEVAEKLARLDDQQTRIQRDLDQAERTLDDVRHRYGFTDLEEHDYPHPITVRLIRLQNEEDDCALDVNQLQTRRDLLGQLQKSPSGKADPNQAAEIKDIELKIKLMQSRCAELGKMREVTQKKHEELDLARVQYVQRQLIRDERRAALDSVKDKLEELKMLHDNPDVSGLQLVDLAGIPQEADSLPKLIVLPIAGGAGLLIGVICALSAGRKTKPSQQIS